MKQFASIAIPSVFIVISLYYLVDWCTGVAEEARVASQSLAVEQNRQAGVLESILLQVSTTQGLLEGLSARVERLESLEYARREASEQATGQDGDEGLNETDQGDMAADNLPFLESTRFAHEGLLTYGDLRPDERARQHPGMLFLQATPDLLAGVSFFRENHKRIPVTRATEELARDYLFNHIERLEAIEEYVAVRASEKKAEYFDDESAAVAYSKEINGQFVFLKDGYAVLHESMYTDIDDFPSYKAAEEQMHALTETARALGVYGATIQPVKVSP